MKPREYCCCAIPVIYTGIYATLTEQFVLGILAGTLSIGTPSIVGAATPSFAKWLFAIICYVGAAIQLMGFASVRQEKPILFRRYLTLHILITLAAFSIAGVWIVISAARHSTAQSSCTTTFFPGSSTDTITRDESNVLCKIIPWVDVGVMVALWVLLAVAQLYFYVVLSSYSAGQERDQRAYDSVYDPSKPLASDIPLATRADTWGLQQSSDVFANSRGYHDRSDSINSVSTIMGDKAQQSRDYDGYAQTPYRPTEPANALTQDPGPTPGVTEGYTTGGYTEGVEYPERTQPHPAIGSFRRKTPRFQRPQSEDFIVDNSYRI